jgi:hypothetical protein
MSFASWVNSDPKPYVNGEHTIQIIIDFGGQSIETREREKTFNGALHSHLYVFWRCYDNVFSL